MKCYLPIVLIAVSLAGDPPKKDSDKIQGTWEVSRIELNGKTQPKGPLVSPVKVTFEGDKLLTRVGKRQPEPRGTVKLDQSRDPKAYDLSTSEGPTVLGIYKLDGDTLSVCLSAPGDERPTTWTTALDDGRTLLIYEREKPPAGK